MATCTANCCPTNPSTSSGFSHAAHPLTPKERSGVALPPAVDHAVQHALEPPVGPALAHVARIQDQTVGHWRHIHPGALQENLQPRLVVREQQSEKAKVGVGPAGRQPRRSVGRGGRVARETRQAGRRARRAPRQQSICCLPAPLDSPCSKCRRRAIRFLNSILSAAKNASNGRPAVCAQQSLPWVQTALQTVSMRVARQHRTSSRA